VIVVADTSVLINLCRVGHGALPMRLFGDVVIPAEVASEFERLAAADERFSGLELPTGIRQAAPGVILEAVRNEPGLDPGEAAAISLALELRADAVLIDERHGRETAMQLGLRTVGILGMLLQAKTAGLLPSVSPVMDSLMRDAGFWISSSLRSRVLELAGEAEA
jgi:hypothetical protein